MLFLAQFIFWILFLVWLACSAFLVLVILNQEPKGGGVGGVFAQGSALGDQLGLSGMQTQLRVLTRNSAVLFFLLSALLAYSGQKIFHVVPTAISQGPAELSADNGLEINTNTVQQGTQEASEAEADGGEPIESEAAETSEPVPAASEEKPAEAADSQN